MASLILVQPKNTIDDTAYAPLGLLSLAAWLRPEFESRIVDLRYTCEDYLHGLIGVHRPKVVGFSVLTGSCILEVIRMCREIKKKYPHVKTVLGGVHPTITPQQTVAHESVDYVVIGDGELGLKDIMLDQAHTGIVYRSKLKGLDALPRPAWDLISVQKYIKRLGGLNIYTSKGCPFPCTFCHNTYYNKFWRPMSAERTAADMAFLHSQYGVRHFIIHDDNFVVSKERALQFAESLRSYKIDVTFSINIRVDAVEGVFLNELRLAGLTEIRLGCESGSSRVLREVLKKDIDPEHIIKAVQIGRALRLKVLCSFVIGWPSEHKTERQDTIKLALKIRKMYKDARIYALWIYNPYPGTWLFERAIARGFKTPKTLEEWGSHYWGESHLPWISNPHKYKNIHLMSRVAFYQGLNPLRLVLRALMSWRMSYNIWLLPLDVWMVRGLMKSYRWIKRRLHERLDT